MREAARAASRFFFRRSQRGLVLILRAIVVVLIVLGTGPSLENESGAWTNSAPNHDLELTTSR